MNALQWYEDVSGSHVHGLYSCMVFIRARSLFMHGLYSAAAESQRDLACVNQPLSSNSVVCLWPSHQVDDAPHLHFPLRNGVMCALAFKEVRWQFTRLQPHSGIRLIS